MMRVMRIFIVLFSALCTCSCEQGGRPGAAGVKNEFFALDTGTQDAKHRSASVQVQMVKKLGYDGIACSLANAPEMIEETEGAGLKLYGVYFFANIDDGRQPFNPLLPKVIQTLEGSDCVLWMLIRGGKDETSDENDDEAAVELVRKIADMVAESGLKVALYPHVRFRLESTEDALRIIDKAERDNLGMVFNLYHCMKVEGAGKVEASLRAAREHILFVNINGSSNEGSIETLDRGEYDLYGFLKALKGLDYNGPIGFQGYGIGGNAYDNLERTMRAWRKFRRRLAVEEAVKR